MSLILVIFPPDISYKEYIKNIKFIEDLPMIITRQFGFNYPSGFREEAF
jgi:hypothetical protein